MKTSKIFIVTYVGLSESDHEANGYSETKAFKNLSDAKMYMDTLAKNERTNCEEEGREYEILCDTERDYRMSWCSHEEQIRISIHNVELK